jgi:hypothetical protein
VSKADYAGGPAASPAPRPPSCCTGSSAPTLSLRLADSYAPQLDNQNASVIRSGLAIGILHRTLTPRPPSWITGIPKHYGSPSASAALTKENLGRRYGLATSCDAGMRSLGSILLHCRDLDLSFVDSETDRVLGKGKGCATRIVMPGCQFPLLLQVLRCSGGFTSRSRRFAV